MLNVLPADLILTRIIARLPPADRWRLRCASKRVAGMGEPDFVEVAMETAKLVGIHTAKFDAFRQVQELVFERLPFDYLGPLRRWFQKNNVRIDQGGFYTPLDKIMRVRIALWDSGVNYEFGSQVKWVRGKHRLVRTCKRVAKEGFLVYAVV